MKSLLILALFCICQDSFVLAKKHRDATTATASAPSCDLIKSMKVAINHLFKRGPDGFIQLMSDSLRFGKNFFLTRLSYDISTSFSVCHSISQLRGRL